MKSLKEQLGKAKDLLLSSARPFFLFDDDPDGLASFLLLYKMVHAGKGMALKGAVVDERMAEKVNAYQPDLVVFLDKAEVAQEFFDEVKTPCIWIDHHEPKKRNGNITYVNPRSFNAQDNQPTSLLCYQITEEDAWIAAVGIVADWQMPPKNILDICEKEYPGFIDTTITNPPEALFTNPVGELARMFSFNLKGRMSEVLASMKILTRIKNPNELLKKEHSQAKFVMKKYEQRLSEYVELRSKVEIDESSPLIVFVYDEAKNSYTTDLSNELLFKFPDKMIIIARKSGESYKCSLRSSTMRVDMFLKQVLELVGGSGGGHEHACGAVIPEDSWEEFLKALRKEVKG